MRYSGVEKLMVDLLCNEVSLYDFRGCTHAKVRDFFRCSVGRIAVKYFRKNDVAIRPVPVLYNFKEFENAKNLSRKDRLLAQERARYFSSAYHDEITDIVDFLNISVVENVAWTNNLDSLGRPKKLMKCGDMDALILQSDIDHDRRWLRDRNLNRERNRDHLGLGNLCTRQHPITEKDEREYANLGAGYRLVQLLTREALQNEGLVMQHCIGFGLYDQYLNQTDVVLLLSLRDAENNSLATLMVYNFDGTYFIGQFRTAKNNKAEQYMKDLVAPLNFRPVEDFYQFMDERNRANITNEEDLNINRINGFGN